MIILTHSGKITIKKSNIFYTGIETDYVLYNNQVIKRETKAAYCPVSPFL